MIIIVLTAQRMKLSLIRVATLSKIPQLSETENHLPVCKLDSTHNTILPRHPFDLRDKYDKEYSGHCSMNSRLKVTYSSSLYKKKTYPGAFCIDIIWNM